MLNKIQKLLAFNANRTFVNFPESSFHAVNSMELNFYNSFILVVENFFKHQEKTDKFKIKLGIESDQLETDRSYAYFKTSRIKADKIIVAPNNTLENLFKHWVNEQQFNFNLKNPYYPQDEITNVLHSNLYGLKLSRDKRYEAYLELLDSYFERNNISHFKIETTNFIKKLQKDEPVDIHVCIPYKDGYRTDLLLSTSANALFLKRLKYKENLEKTDIEDVSQQIFKAGKAIFDHLVFHTELYSGKDFSFNVTKESETNDMYFIVSSNSKVIYNEKIQDKNSDFIFLEHSASYFINEQNFGKSLNTFINDSFLLKSDSNYKQNIFNDPINQFSNILKSEYEKKILNEILYSKTDSPTLNQRKRI